MNQKIPAKELALRGGLPHFFKKARSGKPVTVAYFGGSITAHQGWRPISFKGLQEMFPESEMEMVNAAVGGTGSIVGVFRADDDLIPSKPDLVFIEFAVNDGRDAVRRPKDV
ncbi:MAG: SGNH/GDSL hydrolase family protein, partial [Verrucomicrobiota bacterium]